LGLPAGKFPGRVLLIASQTAEEAYHNLSGELIIPSCMEYQLVFRFAECSSRLPLLETEAAEMGLDDPPDKFTLASEWGSHGARETAVTASRLVGGKRPEHAPRPARTKTTEFADQTERHQTTEKVLLTNCRSSLIFRTDPSESTVT
jgi:hypothetical protein